MLSIGLRFLPVLFLLQFAIPAAAQDTKSSDEEWKIEEAHGPYEELRFTTDEGTWMALDVHPDGSEIVFSLLGDLYRLPIGGGQATRITSGTAYDVQPRYSPDGKTIAFASDRSGCENLWICDRDGGNARAISKEKRKTVNGPAWSPDGQYLIGRKRLTDTSSLGTVELWMYHLEGGDGVQVTEKDAQPDAADPVFSADERFLYFSARDARFRYDRNVYQGIWQVKRLDRRTGQVVPITSGSGGAAAPSLSPDGKTLAFVRREDAQTNLHLMDLATGATRKLAEGLTRDNQEGFAFHGTFPAFDWTRDGRAIVATAEGKFWRWNVGTGARTAIPFRAQVEQRISKALRYPQPLGSERFPVRILRWPTESADGKHLVFSALGQLYAMSWPQGVPQRITPEESFHFCPSFSRDGKRITFVSWNDTSGGHVWVGDFVRGRIRNARTITRHSGHYANPGFSPDGRRVVYLKGSGAAFRDQDFGGELWHELHWSPIEGGESRYIIGTRNRGTNRRMTRPQFSPDGERIYYLENQAGSKPQTVPKTVLASVELEGTDRREHLLWAKAEEVSVSPDGRWVLFSELHNAYLTAFPRANDKPVEIKTKGAPVPVLQLSKEGGEWVQWADGGRTLTWAYGPEYSRLALSQAVAHLRSDSKDLPEASTQRITFQAQRDAPTDQRAYVGARIITMDGDEVIDNGAIVTRGNRIVFVGPSSAYRNASPRFDAPEVDVRGRTIIPGLFDEHAHLHYSSLDILPQRPWKYLANLAYGVTSTHDPSASTHEVFAQGEMVEAGIIPGPRIFSTGFILYGADNAGRAIVESLDDARAHLRRMKKLGAFTVKSYMQPSREQRQWVLQAAREEEIMVMPEGGGDFEMNMGMILDGHTTLEHALPLAPLYHDTIQLFGNSGTAYCPTLLVAYGGLSGENWFYQHYEVWKDQKLRRFTPPGVIDARSRIRTVMAGDEDWHHIDVAAGAHEILHAGGLVVMGGHGQLQGLGPHWEMWTFVQGGMSPMEALRVSTIMPAQALGLDAQLGSLQAGKLADFVVLGANPLERIENSDSVELVVKNGRPYRLEDLVRRPLQLR